VRNSRELKMAITKRVATDLKNPQLSKTRLTMILHHEKIRQVLPIRELRRAYNHRAFSITEYLEEVIKRNGEGRYLTDIVDYILLKEQFHLLSLFNSPLTKRIRFAKELSVIAEQYEVGRYEFVSAMQEEIFSLAKMAGSPSRWGGGSIILPTFLTYNLSFFAKNMVILSRKKGEIDRLVNRQIGAIGAIGTINTLHEVDKRNNGKKFILKSLKVLYAEMRRTSKFSFAVYHKAVIRNSAPTDPLRALFEEIENSPLYT
jgi:hypothetical protein